MTNTTYSEAGGFAAGTLVHTQGGLKPIEQIQVGDYVLSKRESGEGEQEYKRVTQTFEHEDRQVIFFSAGGFQADEVHRYYDLAVTPEHPIWLQGKGWKKAGKIKATYPPTKLGLLTSENPNVASNIRLFKTDHPDIAWHPLMSKADYLGSMGKRVHVPSMQVVETDVFIGIDYVLTAKRAKPEHLFTTTVYNLQVEDFHTYYVGEPGIWVGTPGGKAAQTLLEKATDKAAKAKPKPISAVAPFTVNKMDAALKVALWGDSLLGDPNSPGERYKLVNRRADFTSTTQFVEYSLSELFGGRSGIGILLKVERPHSRLKLTARTLLPLECFPLPASLSEQEKSLFHSSVLGATVTSEYVIDESLETHHLRLDWRRTGERISPDELPWYNLQDINAIKPAIDDSIALTLALGEKCQSLKGIAWLYNSTDPEAARLFTGNIGNQDFLTDPNGYIQARSLYLAWRLQDPRFESFCRDYISRWEKPRKREVIETHPYYRLPRYAELLRNTPPPDEAGVSAFFSG